MVLVGRDSGRVSLISDIAGEEVALLVAYRFGFDILKLLTVAFDGCRPLTRRRCGLRVRPRRRAPPRTCWDRWTSQCPAGGRRPSGRTPCRRPDRPRPTGTGATGPGAPAAAPAAAAPLSSPLTGGGTFTSSLGSSLPLARLGLLALALVRERPGCRSVDRLGLLDLLLDNRIAFWAWCRAPQRTWWSLAPALPPDCGGDHATMTGDYDGGYGGDRRGNATSASSTAATARARTAAPGSRRRRGCLLRRQLLLPSSPLPAIAVPYFAV